MSDTGRHWIWVGNGVSAISFLMKMTCVASKRNLEETILVN